MDRRALLARSVNAVHLDIQHRVMAPSLSIPQYQHLLSLIQRQHSVLTMLNHYQRLFAQHGCQVMCDGVMTPIDDVIIMSCDKYSTSIRMTAVVDREANDAIMLYTLQPQDGYLAFSSELVCHEAVSLDTLYHHNITTITTPDYTITLMVVTAAAWCSLRL